VLTSEPGRRTPARVALAGPIQAPGAAGSSGGAGGRGIKQRSFNQDIYVLSWGGIKTRQFLKLLKANGATVDASRGKGGHVLVTLNGKQTTVPSHGDTDFDPDFLDDICKQRGTRLRELNR